MTPDFLAALDARRALALLDDGPADPTEVARFRIRQRLGTGASASVYLAEDPALERPIALKVLAPALSADARAVARFLEEARLLAGLDHPRIVTVHEAGRDPEGRLWIAMAYHAGRTLRERLQEGALPLAEACAIARDVADALAAAHAAGLTHRDVKPENILLTAHGACLLDFGIAAISGHQLTTASASLGTPSYMSPEQTRGDAVDARTDVWSLGVVLYEMLAGVRPFAGANGDAIVYGIRHDAPVPLRQRRREVPRPLAGLVEACLAKDPARRPASAAAFRAALDAPHAPARSRLLLLAVPVLFLAALPFLARRQAAVPAPRAASGLPVLAVLPLASEAAALPEFLRDGVAELLLADLAREAGVRVISPMAVAVARRTATAPADIGARVGATAVLDGRLGLEGDSLVLSTTLRRVPDGASLRELRVVVGARDVPTLVEEVRRGVVLALGVAPVPARRRDPVAVEHLLRGQARAREQTSWSLDRAESEFAAAVRRDPRFAEAHVELARVAEQRGGGDGWYPIARAHVTQALAADPRHPVALQLASAYAALHERDWRRADSLSALALDGEPSSVQQYVNRALVLMLAGRGEAAVDVMRSARAIDPLSSTTLTVGALALVVAGRPAEALPVIRQSMTVDSAWTRKHLVHGRALLALGRVDEAIAQFQRSTAEYGGFDSRALLGHALAVAGRRAEAAAIAAELAEHATQRGGAPTDVAVVQLGLGDTAAALDWLARVPPRPGTRFLPGDPIWDPLRSHPRFTRILGDLGLEAPAR